MIKNIKTAALLVLLSMSLVAGPLYADEIPPAFRTTGYALPRYVSLSKGQVFVRAGPGQHYPVKWIYHKAGLPVEIILEFEHWRKIRDVEGAEGWVFYSMLSGARTGIIQSDLLVPMRRKSRDDARLVAQLAHNVVVKLKECVPAWCRAEKGDLEGWVERKYIWGIYETENFD